MLGALHCIALNMLFLAIRLVPVSTRISRIWTRISTRFWTCIPDRSSNSELVSYVHALLRDTCMSFGPVCRSCIHNGFIIRIGMVSND
jgi:hypothetical protein